MIQKIWTIRNLGCNLISEIGLDFCFFCDIKSTYQLIFYNSNLLILWQK
ncbi:MAG: hypothetical protein UY05_C0018G0006 [Candidatus Peregrinibacteria bacterium GW2011_GWA2_47_7]|nr:MAG: hypothetical protein UY05_C0018G0006 [Candidatus Peregrinibacteria bacterium GW2011_GWA2_47_7]